MPTFLGVEGDTHTTANHTRRNEMFPNKFNVIQPRYTEAQLGSTTKVGTPGYDSKVTIYGYRIKTHYTMHRKRQYYEKGLHLSDDENII